MVGFSTYAIVEPVDDTARSHEAEVSASPPQHIFEICSHQKRDVQTRTAQLLVLAALGTSSVANALRASRDRQSKGRNRVEAP